MSTAPYADASEVLADRVRWSIAALARLVNRGRAEGWIDGAPSEADDPVELAARIEARIAATPRDPTRLPMSWLALRLELDGDALALLWLLACIEIDPGAARLARALGSNDCPDPSLQILRQLFLITDVQLEALERLALIELQGDPRVPQHRRTVRAHDRVIALARGELELDREVARVAVLAGPSQGVAAPAELATALVADPAPVVQAIGPEGAGRQTILAAAAANHARGTLRVDGVRISATPATVERTVRAVLREARLFGVIPLFRDLDATRDAAAIAALDRELADLPEAVLVTARSPLRFTARPAVVHRMTRPDRAARRQQWAAVVGAVDDVIARAADQYALWPGAISAAGRNARATAGETAPITSEVIHAGVRAHLGEQLEGLATRIDWRQTWRDLVLPADQFEQLIELVARVRHRGHVLETWGFGAKVGKGHGIAALLSGPPGTGKTMVAGLVAQELGLDLYQVDLSKIVSKYIGETEKQLGALFDAAESGQAIVLFDEADALFAKRTGVKSSNDRYANLEVNFLLQRLEAFTGIALLTTNHETAIDEAFRRRLALHVRFPMPDADQRALLWRAMLPEAAEVAPDLTLDRLAHDFEMSGGYIKNAVLRAAYLAADEGAAIGMPHLWRAARAEYESIGKLAYERAA